MLFRDRAIVSDTKGLGSFGRQFIHAEHAGNQGARYARSDASSDCGLGVARNGAFRAYSHGSSIVAACGGIGGPCANSPWVCPMKKLEPARSEPADLRRINTGGLPASRAV